MMANETPVVLLAFANARGDLHTLRDEQRALQELFETLQRSGHCRLVFRPDITLEQLFEVLQEDRERLVLFHYGGHAGADRLMFDSGTGESPAFAGGLATLLGQCRGLKVVFLNGCSTGPQVKALLDAGVPAVIATARPIRDAVARDLAVAFYKALTTGDKECRIDRGQNLLGAFEAAKGFVSTAEGANRSSLLDVGRDLVGEDVSDLTGMPWDLYPSEPPISVARWTLFDKDPYFGLPGIPEDIPLPPKPFIHLEHFQRKHAPVFFGRGAAIRVLYDLIRNPASPKVILYYGPTGVGKSSVLDAGLLPRIERTQEVVYCRRDESHGLLGTLRRAIGGDEKRPLIELWTERATMTGRPLVVVVDQAEEAFTRPIAIVPEGNEEDALKRPWTDPDAELRGFAMALRELLGGAARPMGQVIVAFRNERLQEVRAAFDAVLLKVAEVPLAPLGRQELIEIIQKPCAMTRYNLSVEEGLADHIADELVKNGEAREAVAPTLQVLLSRMYAEFPEDPLSARPFSFELYRHLKTSGLLLSDFLDLGLKALSVLGQAEGDAVRSGQVLEVLMEYTTEWGTAKALRQEELRERFPEKRGEAVSRLADRLEGLYLLSRPGQSARHLALVHDTLAPVVRHAHQLSIAPAQRARRLLENKSPEWKDGAEGTVLDATQLAAVEEGLSAMRRMMPDEERLVVASREQEKRRREEESERKRRVEEAEKAAREAKEGQLRFFRRAAVALAAAFALSLIAAGVAVVQWNSARESKEEAERRRVAAEAESLGVVALRQFESGRGPSALRAAFQAGQSLRGLAGAHMPLLVYPATSPLLALQLILDDNTEVDRKEHASAGDGQPADWPPSENDSDLLRIRLPDGKETRLRDIKPEQLATFMGHQGRVLARALSPDGRYLVTTGVDGTVRLREPHSKRPPRMIGLLGGSTSIRFHPDSQHIIAENVWKTIVTWDLSERNVARHSVTLAGHEATALTVAYRPDGRLLASGGQDGMIRTWTPDGKPAGKPIQSGQGPVVALAFSPDQTRLLSVGQGGDVRQWDPSGQPLGRAEGRGPVVDACFSPDRRHVAMAFAGGSVQLLDLVTQKSIPLRVRHQGWVMGVTFSADGTLVATAGADDTVRFSDLSGKDVGPTIRANQDQIEAVSLSLDGRRLLTAGFDGTARVWDRSGKLVVELIGHQNKVLGAWYNPEGTMLVTAGADGTVRVWLTSGQQVAQFRGMYGSLSGEALGGDFGTPKVGFSPDGHWIAIPQEGGTIRVYRLESLEELLDQAAEWLGESKS